jgi:hypothetical protein
MNSRTARNPEPFLYKWVTDSRLIRLPRNGRRCDACPTRLVGLCGVVSLQSRGGCGSGSTENQGDRAERSYFLFIIAQ